MRQPNPQEPPHSHWPKLSLTLAMAIPVLLVLVTLPWPFGRHGHPPGSTQNRMKQWGLIFKMYANESEGNLWPPLARNSQLWTPDLAGLYPDYLNPANIDLLIAREHPDRDAIRTTLQAILNQPNPDYDTTAGLMALSFAYLGYAVRDVEGFEAVVDSIKSGHLGSGGTVEKESSNRTAILPLRDGIERFFLSGGLGPDPTSKAQEFVPVLIEVARWRTGRSMDSFDGAYVLYMDGHVENVPLGTFPVVPEVMNVLSGNVR